METYGKRIGALIVVFSACFTLLMLMAAVYAFSEAFAATMQGTDRHDTLYGTTGNDTIKGLGGPDTLFGKAGNDTLIGGKARDTLYGGSGNDDLYGGPDGTQGPDHGDDRYYCGKGVDTVHVEKSEHSPHSFGPKCENVVKER